MEWYTLFLINIGILVLLFSVGMPIAISFFCINIVFLILLMGPGGLMLFINSMFESVTSFSLAALPMFILMGNILDESNAVGIMFDAVDKWIGRVRARLHVIALIVATVFSAIGGSNIGTTAMLGASILPEMNRRGYDKKLSAGTIMAGASLDPIIPPSNMAIILAMLAKVSTAKLLISGVLPGLVISGILIIYVLIRVKLNPSLAPPYDVGKTPLRAKVMALVKMLPFTVVMFLVIGLILVGVATPTEGAAAGVLGSLFIAALFKRLNWQTLKNSMSATMKVSGMVLIIMGSAAAFSQVMALSGATRGIVSFLAHVSVPRYGMLAIMEIIPLILLCFMDQISLLMILVPIYIPIVNALHFDPIWFWCTILINITIGALTPPFGYVLFTLKGTTKEMSLEEIYQAAIPFVFLLIFGMFLVILFPWIATWLPSRL